MVLQVVYGALTAVLPPRYWPHAAVAGALLLVVYAYAKGPRTNRERDLHARVVLLTVSVCFRSRSVGLLDLGLCEVVSSGGMGARGPRRVGGRVSDFWLLVSREDVRAWPRWRHLGH